MKLAKVSNKMFSPLPTFPDPFFSRDLRDWTTSNFMGMNNTLPAVNIREEDEAFLIDVAAPGLSKDHFRINLNQNLLTISYEWREEKEDQESNYSRQEFSYQAFQRSFNMPEGSIVSEKISARYLDGILRITLPKREEMKPKPARKIEIM